MKKIGCPFPDNIKCPFVCSTLKRPSRCLKYDDANLCAKANAKKKRAKRTHKRNIEKGVYWWADM